MIKRVLFLVLLFPLITFADAIKEIRVEGNQRIEKSTIKKYLEINEGTQYSKKIENTALKNLYSKGLFEDIKISFKDKILHVNVQEVPLIVSVSINGSKQKKTLMKEIKTKPGTSLNRNKIEEDVYLIKEIYKQTGRFLTKVDTKIIPQDNNRAKVIFHVIEGPKTSVKHVNFTGNHYYKDSELKSIILTKEKVWYRFLDDDSYNQERIEYDKELLKTFYRSVGFADVEVSALVELSKTKDYFSVLFIVNEGKEYKFGDISVQNNISTIPDEDINKFIKIKEGETYNGSLLDTYVRNVAEDLAKKGYPQMAVHYHLNKNYEQDMVDVVFIVNKAPKVFVNNINISGNIKTEDKVIRREFKIAEGDVFNRDLLSSSYRGIRNLDYFQQVDMHPIPVSDDRYDINVSVEEKSTASINLDTGYNSIEKMFAGFSFHERNFAGTGRSLDLSIKGTKKKINYSAGIVDPYFLGKNLSLGTHIFYLDSSSGAWGESKAYSSKTIGGRVSLGYDIIDDLSHNVFYSIKQEKSLSGRETSSQLIKEQMGKHLTSAIGQSLTFDQTDNRAFPKNGYILTANQEYAGLGGDVKYLKHELDGSIYKSFFKNDYTLKLAFNLGHIQGVGSKKVRISDRFQLGDFSFRGFEMGGVGPRDKQTKEGLGGRKYYTITTELGFPVFGIPKEFNLTGIVFADYGCLWDIDIPKDSSWDNVLYDKSPRMSVGVGMLWVTRMFPLRLDWGIPIKKKKYDETQRWHIRFSTHL